jgi:hypothetical protein
MATVFTSLQDLRIPGRPDLRLELDGKPLSIIDEGTINENSNDSELTAAIGVATVLYKWCPEALFALIDIENWFSFTWTLTLENETKIEIGRIRNQITMGTLDKDELWKVMISYNISPLEQNLSGGSWLPNTEETLLDNKNVDDSTKIDKLGVSFVTDLVLNRRWLTGKKIRHEFFVESPNIGIEPWEDGIRMNPHWLYKSLDLSRCTTCESGVGSGVSLNRCGRCGTAAYCSTTCQAKDWPVHKGVCSMTMEDRGKALHYTQYGGLVGWKENSGDE